MMLDALQRPAASTTGDEADAEAREAVRRDWPTAGPRGRRRHAVDDRRQSRRTPRRRLPAVTVLVTLFNYRQHVARCLDSVLAATPPLGGLEIVVVDDASSDGGPIWSKRVMGSTSVPMLLARKALNTGLADARNVGLSLARGRQVFVLDADNWIYPPCLAVLQDGAR